MLKFWIFFTDLTKQSTETHWCTWLFNSDNESHGDAHVPSMTLKSVGQRSAENQLILWTLASPSAIPRQHSSPFKQADTHLAKTFYEATGKVCWVLSSARIKRLARHFLGQDKLIFKNICHSSVILSCCVALCQPKWDLLPARTFI